MLNGYQLSEVHRTYVLKSYIQFSKPCYFKIKTSLTGSPSSGHCPNDLYRALTDINRYRLFRVTWLCNDDIISVCKIGLKRNSCSKTPWCPNLMNTKLTDIWLFRFSNVMIPYDNDVKSSKEISPKRLSYFELRKSPNPQMESHYILKATCGYRVTSFFNASWSWEECQKRLSYCPQNYQLFLRYLLPIFKVSAWVLIPPSKPQLSNFFCPPRHWKTL